MFMEWKRSRKSFTWRTHLFYCVSIFLLCVCALLSIISTRTVYLDIRSLSGRGADRYFQELKTRNKIGFSSLNIRRRYLSFPGSSPPRCKSKCGKCTPCRAVHVPVPPGTPVTTEYYPEAWRCKCGNKLYIP